MLSEHFFLFLFLVWEFHHLHSVRQLFDFVVLGGALWWQGLEIVALLEVAELSGRFAPSPQAVTVFGEVVFSAGHVAGFARRGSDLLDVFLSESPGGLHRDAPKDFDFGPHTLFVPEVSPVSVAFAMRRGHHCCFTKK